MITNKSVAYRPTSEMTYNVSMWTLNPTIPYHTIPYHTSDVIANLSLWIRKLRDDYWLFTSNLRYFLHGFSVSVSRQVYMLIWRSRKLNHRFATAKFISQFAPPAPRCDRVLALRRLSSEMLSRRNRWWADGPRLFERNRILHGVQTCHSRHHDKPHAYH